MQGLGGNRKNLVFQEGLERDAQVFQRSHHNEGRGAGELAGQEPGQAGSEGWRPAVPSFSSGRMRRPRCGFMFLGCFLIWKGKVPSLFPLLEQRPFPAFLPSYLKKVN